MIITLNNGTELITERISISEGILRFTDEANDKYIISISIVLSIRTE